LEFPGQSATSRINDIFSLFALGERVEIVPKKHDPSAFFQDANYHDQIVKDQN